MTPIPPFCPEWLTYSVQPVTTQEAYVLSELARIDAAGLPILSTVLQCGHEGAAAIAAKLLGEHRQYHNKPAVRTRVWRLRLVDRLVPADQADPKAPQVDDDGRPLPVLPVLDPQGRPLPKDDRGKVLVAKVGNLGGDRPMQGGEPDREWAAKARQRKAATRADIYKTVAITRDGTDLEYHDAMVVLRRWGRGIPTKPEKWLVEEVPLPPIVAPATTDAGKQRKAG